MQLFVHLYLSYQPMRAAILIFFIIAIALADAAYAQKREKRQDRRTKRVIVNNPDLWNYSIINLWENPALAGEDRRHNITSDLTTSPSEDNVKVSYDFLPMQFKKSLAVGVGAYYLLKNSSAFNNSRRHTTCIAGSLKYQFKNESNISFGVSLGMVYEKYSSALFAFSPSYFSDTSYFPYGEAGTQMLDGWHSNIIYLETKLTRFGPLNLGAWYNGKNYFAGVSINNVTRGNESHIGERQPSPVYFQLAGGYHFNIKDKAVITPSFIYRTQGFLMHRVDPRVTVSLLRSRLLFGTYYQSKRLCGMIGADLFTHFQLTMEIGGNVSNKIYRPDSFIKMTFRVHFATGGKKSQTGDL